MYKLQSIASMVGIIGLFALFAFTLMGWVGALMVVGPGLLFNGLSIGRPTGLIVHLHRVGAKLTQRAGIACPERMVYLADMPTPLPLMPDGSRWR